MTLLTRFLDLDPEHVDPDLAERAHIALAVCRKALDLPPIRIQWVMAAPSWWAGKAHEVAASWHGWIHTDRPDVMYLDPHRCAGRIAFAVAHEARHLDQARKGWEFDYDRWEADANQWATEALRIPVAWRPRETNT